MTTQYVTLQNPLAAGDVLTITVAGAPVPPQPPVISDLQAALNATKPGSALDCGNATFTETHIVVPANVGLIKFKMVYGGTLGAAQTAMLDLSAGSMIDGIADGAGLAYATVRAWVGATKAQIVGCDISGGRYLGVIGYQCDGLTISGGRIHGNNAAGGQEGYEAGGVKLGNTSGYAVTGVQVDSNKGPGVWEDVSCSGGIVTLCHVHDNSFSGIMSEISTLGAVISANSVWECGWGDNRGAFNGGILLSSTTGANATGNTIAWCPEGIAAISQKGRASSVKGTRATANVIAVSAGHTAVQTYAESGAPTDWGPWTPNGTATAAQLTAAGIPTAPQAGH